MKKLLLLTLMLWSSLNSGAQITVTSSTFPATGDVLHYVEAANPNVATTLFTPPGANQSWDLSALTPASTFEVSYRPAAEGIFNADFPGATMVVSKGADEYYNTSSATKFEGLGHASNSIGGLPLNAIYKNQPLLAERHAPLNFFDIYQQSSNNLLIWAYSEIPNGAFSLPAVPDSVRFRINKQVIETVDAWGTLRLPGPVPQSEFPVLRLKRTTYLEQRIDAKIPPLGWLDVTDNVVQNGSTWGPLFGVDTVVTHHYFNDLSKEEIAVLTFNNAQNAVLSVVYKEVAASTSVAETQRAHLPSLQVYPNPAVSTVSISCTDAPSGVYTVKLFSGLGMVVQESKHLLVENGVIQVALPAGVEGLYFCRLENAGGDIMGTSRLIVIYTME
jgi:hypothetical protein